MPIDEAETMKRIEESLTGTADHHYFNAEGYWTQALEGFYRLMYVPFLKREWARAESWLKEAEAEVRELKDGKEMV